MFTYVALASVVLIGLALPASSLAQAPTNNQPWGPMIRRVDQLPDRPLYWRLQTFATRAEAEAAAGPTGQVGEAEGQVWLFTLGRPGEAPTGGELVAEIGPLEVPSAAEYALQVDYRIVAAGGTAGVAAGAAVHSHPGAESFYVLAGEQTVWTPGLQTRTEAGQSWAGVPAGTPMILVNTGREERRAFSLFVGDAQQPATQPTIFP